MAGVLCKWPMNDVFIVQVASSERTLGIQIQHYQSFFNVGSSGDHYCCCDQPHTCMETIAALNSTFNCAYECQAYFVVHFLGCNIGGCFITDTFNYSDVSLSTLISSLVFQVPLMPFVPDNQVRLIFKAQL